MKNFCDPYIVLEHFNKVEQNIETYIKILLAMRKAK